jgi:hypothetical protein
MNVRFKLGAVVALSSFVLAAQAGVFFDISPGTAAPPGTLGGYSMIGFPSENRAEFDTVTDVAVPPSFSSPLIFDQGMELDFVGSGWGTWSHGYQGAVYQLFEEAVSGTTEVTMTLPPDTLAFYTYIQPNQKDVYEFTVTSDGKTTTLDINGDGGARYVGFWTDNASDPLVSIMVNQPDGNGLGLAVGEFGINGIANAPDPGSWLNILIALASLGLFSWKVRR